MGMREKSRDNNGRFKIKYPHSIDDRLLSMYARGMSTTEISKETGISIDTVRRRLKMKGANPSAIRFITSKGGYRKKGRLIPWNDEMVRRLIELYPFHSNVEIAEILELTKRQIKQKGLSLGLRKDADWLKETRTKQMQWATIKSKQSQNKFRFQKGNTYAKKHWFQKGTYYGKEYWERYRTEKTERHGSLQP